MLRNSTLQSGIVLVADVVIILVRAKLVHLVACKFTEEAMMSGSDSETRRVGRMVGGGRGGGSESD